MSYSYGTGVNANYSGRPIVYPNQVPFDTDVLREAQYRMVDIANLAQAVLGLPPTIGGAFQNYCSGLCLQNGSPNMTVNLGVCSIYSLQQMEPIAYGNLGPLTTPTIFKQASNMLTINSSTLSGGTFVAPSSGNWQYYLIQGQFNTAQINNVNRPYYNASNPASPNFAVAADTEIDNIIFTVVAGTPSSKSGALPALPTVGAGNVGMFLILVSDNTTSIINSLISGYPGTYIGTTLTQMPAAVQGQDFSYGVDTSGAANTIAANVFPAVTSYTAGLRVSILIANTVTGASTLNLNGVGTAPVKKSSLYALTGGEAITGMLADFEFDGTNFQLTNAITPNVVSSVIAAGSAVSMTSATSRNITQISVPPGTWLLFGNVSFISGSSALTSAFAWTSTTSASGSFLPDSSLFSLLSVDATELRSNAVLVPMLPYTFATTTTVYLSAQVTYTGGSVTGCGGIYAINID